MALKALRELPDVEMAPGSPNILGWSVHDESEELVGSVVDLMVDTIHGEVRYIGVQLGNGKDVLIPFGAIDLDEDRGRLKVVGHSRTQIEELPPYTPPVLSPELEERYYILFKRTEPVGASRPSPPDYRFAPFIPHHPRLRKMALVHHKGPLPGAPPKRSPGCQETLPGKDISPSPPLSGKAKP